MQPFEEALARVLALGVPVLPGERASIDEADGRVLAEDVVATVDLPGFDYSAMDGYAVRAIDLALGQLPVVGESRTGTVPDPLRERTAMRIFTGGVLPPGADAVVMQENVTREGDVAAFQASVGVGANIRRRGEDMRAGSVAIQRGTRLRPPHLSLAASLDRGELVVAARPSVGFLATGDELRPPGTTASPGTIPESNAVALSAMARRAGAHARALVKVRDDRAATEQALAEALDQFNVVVTIGGVSVGDHDLVRPALSALGVELDFWRVAMKPGKPLAVGRFSRGPSRRDAIVLGLPGNPVSAMVTFALFGLPLLRAMQGDRAPVQSRQRARLARDYTHQPGRVEFVRASLSRAESADCELIVTPLANQASGAASALSDCDALAVVPAELSVIPAGTFVDVLLANELYG